MLVSQGLSQRMGLPGHGEQYSRGVTYWQTSSQPQSGQRKATDWEEFQLLAIVGISAAQRTAREAGGPWIPKLQLCGSTEGICLGRDAHWETALGSGSTLLLPGIFHPGISEPGWVCLTSYPAAVRQGTIVRMGKQRGEVTGLWSHSESVSELRIEPQET